jgi:predicted nucleic acid-binding protein
VDAFDADVIIYAAVSGHRLGSPVVALLDKSNSGDDAYSCVGSVLLLPEVLARPLRDARADEADLLIALLARLTLLEVDRATAELATTMGAKYRLRAADAIHLATAVNIGADRFITNNRRDFDAAAVTELSVTYPDDLPPRGVQRQ